MSIGKPLHEYWNSNQMSIGKPLHEYWNSNQNKMNLREECDK